jgi:hypothetical protein
MKDPKNVARTLVNTFLANGSFELAGGAMAAQAKPASTIAFDDFQGFEGLSIQAVGYAKDSIDEAENGVHLFVTKGSKKAFAQLPPTIEGVPVFVHNTGKVTVKPESAAATTKQGKMFERSSRIACGSSCSPSGSGYAGTFGAIVRRANDDQLFGLSNNHVFADCNHTPIAMPIMSPSEIDAKPGARPPQQICTHEAIVELRSGVPGLVSLCHADLAIAKITNPSTVTSWQGDTAGYDTPAAAITLRGGEKVKKFGRTTGLTHGTILAEALAFSLPYAAKHFSALVWFQEVWTVRADDGTPFALGGDSGSLVVTADGKNAAGLLFAVSPRGEFAYIIPMNRVAASLGGLRLVGNHGL